MKLRNFLYRWALIAVSISRFRLFSGCLKLPFLFKYFAAMADQDEYEKTAKTACFIKKKPKSAGNKL